jgi:hypothetical protein
MKRSSALQLTVAAVAALLLPLAAVAQESKSNEVPILPDNSNVRLDAHGLLAKKPAAGLPDVRAQPQAWPRLDRGSVLCRSAADLSRLAARRHGEPVDGAVDCQVIRNPTGIAIVQRQGPGMTEVRTTNPAAGGTGWTDAWLPDRPPPNR